MKTLATGLSLFILAAALQGCFSFPGFNAPSNSSSQMVPHAFDTGSQDDMNAPARAGELNSGWSNSGNWDRPCQRQFDGSCR